MKDTFDKRIQPWHSFDLPYCWYSTVLNLSRKAHDCALASNEPGAEYVAYSVRLGVCLFDASYIEQALDAVDLTHLPTVSQWHAYLDVGQSLYDLGEREKGLRFLEKAAMISRTHAEDLSNRGYMAPCILCYRMNDRKYAEKRSAFAKLFEGLVPACESGYGVVAKVLVDNGDFNKAESMIQCLIASESQNSVLLADCYFEQGEFGKAASLYDNHDLPVGYDFWRAQFDYKKAIAYYRTSQAAKWKHQATRIGRRLAWDRFYSLDHLEGEGVERISEIDDFIMSVRPRCLLLDSERLRQYVSRLPRIALTTFLWYRYQILCGLFIAGFVLAGISIALQLLFAGAN